MNRFILITFILFAACRHAGEKKTVIDPGWTKTDLSGQWSVYLPAKRMITLNQQSDGMHGQIFLEEDSLVLHLRMGEPEKLLKGLVLGDPCSLKIQTETATLEAKADETEYANEKFRRCKTIIDTIADNIATIKIPVTTGAFPVVFSTRDCRSGKWLTITADSLTQKQEAMALKIFETIGLIRKEMR